MRRGNFSFFIFLVLVLSACGQSRSHSPVFVKPAPTHQNEAGILVNGISRTEVEQLLKSTGGEARELHAQTGFYEIRRADLAILERKLPIHASAIRNLYVKNLLNEEQKAFPHPTLENCHFTESGPIARISALTENERMKKNPIFEKGKVEIALSAIKSFADGEQVKEHQVFWTIQAPEGSQWKDRLFNTMELRFSPDLTGPYDISLIIQDSKLFCHQELLSFGITENTPYAIEPAKTPDSSPENFSHLKEIDAEKAWTRSTGNGVVIAIIDSGVNYNHPDLHAQLLVAKSDHPWGYDFAMGDEFPYDDYGHGTHVTGLALAEVGGVAKGSKFLPIKAMNAMGGADAGSLAAAIQYAADHGARVINCSFSSSKPGLEEILKPAIQYALNKGALVVTASGNGDPFNGEGIDIDVEPVFPAAMDLANVIAVGASLSNGALAPFSNFGKHRVHITAPGDELLGPYFRPEIKRHTRIAGTSMSTALVSGAAALAFSVHPEWSPEEVRKTLMEHSEKIPSLAEKIKSSGVLKLTELFNSQSPTKE